MGLREKLNNRPGVVMAVACALLGLALLGVLYEMLGGGPTANAHVMRYYSDDDGATYFSDSIDLIPPFDHNGRQAVVANIFTCKDEKPFVGYLQRYTPKGMKQIQSPGPGNYPELSEDEVSLPLKGDGGWSKFNSSAGAAIVNVKGPDGSPDVQPLQP